MAVWDDIRTSRMSSSSSKTNALIPLASSLDPLCSFNIHVFRSLHADLSYAVYFYSFRQPSFLMSTCNYIDFSRTSLYISAYCFLLDS